MRMNVNLKFEKSQVLVIGDVMLDRYLYGDTSRISPEAPVPVVKIKQVEDKPGGASNVALNINALGGNAILLGAVGEDEAATTLQKMLEQVGVECYFHKFTNMMTVTKLRVIAHQQQLIRLDFEEKPQDIGKIIKIYSKQLANVNAVIISDYGKGIQMCIPELIRLANANKVPILIDPKTNDFSIYRGATLVTPNLAEFENIVDHCDDANMIAEKGLQLLKEHNIAALLVTRGADGMSLIQEHNEPLHIPTRAQEVYDVTGAGDTVIATLGAALAVGEDLVAATQLANAAAGIVVQKLGAATTSVAELRRALRQQQDSWLGVVSETRLIEEIADAKAHNETIVMTNGCFDILHAGHVAYLEQAKALGARLVVAVNDDASVQRSKGDGRPVNSLAQRMAVLAGLRCIDWIVPFTEDTPERLIKEIAPDFLVKGGDWPVDKIVGGEYVQKYGGKVLSLPYIDDQSTTNIINRIRGE